MITIKQRMLNNTTAVVYCIKVSVHTAHFNAAFLRLIKLDNFEILEISEMSQGFP